MQSTTTKTQPVAAFQTSCVPVLQLSRDQVRQWEALEDRSLEANPFLSPLFVLPAVRHLTPAANVQAILIQQKSASRSRLVGVGIFEVRAATRILPLPHLKAYQAPGNSFLTGLLVDREYAQDALVALFRFLQQQPPHWRHLEFDLRTRGSSFGQLLERVATQFGHTWVGRDVSRPLVCPQDVDRCDPDVYLSKNRRRKCRRTLKSLKTHGAVEFRVRRGGEAGTEAVENFLHLEDQGWKQRGGHSFRSAQQTEQFFREMSTNFIRAGRIFFTELRSGDRVIGSTSNLISGRAAVAFKSGWAVEFARLGIGALQEVELVRHAPQHLADLEYIDSGTGGNSWMQSLWPENRPLTTGVFAGSSLTSRLARMMQMLPFRTAQQPTDPASSQSPADGRRDESAT